VATLREPSGGHGPAADRRDARTMAPSLGGSEGPVTAPAPNEGSASANGPPASLGPIDFALLVVGSIIGDGIYVVSGLGAQHLGPAQLVAWALAGMLAALIGLSFIQCAAIRPEVGGSFAYASAAFGPDAGFLVGWALYLGEIVVLPVFPLAFARYLDYFVPVASGTASVVAKCALVVSLLA
jgi:basic amino acid/polyamine antiporter, APA family